MATTVVAAGGVVLASDMNNALTKRVGTTVVTTSSATWTTITVLMTLTVNLVAGQTYALKFEGRISSSVSAPTTEFVQIKIKPGTTTAATELNIAQQSLASNSAGGFTVDLYAEFTASVSGSQSFVVTGERTTSPAATGNFALRASSTGPAYFICDWINV